MRYVLRFWDCRLSNSQIWVGGVAIVRKFDASGKRRFPRGVDEEGWWPISILNLFCVGWGD